ncbi:MAG: hypothetical protein ACR2K5_06665 [Pseudolabrys sp.]
MEKLHTVLRSIGSESKAGTAPRRDHLDVFREFLDHLNRASCKKAARPARAKRRRRR